MLFNNEEGIGALPGPGRKSGTLILGVEAEVVWNRFGSGLGGSKLSTLRAGLLLEGARILFGVLLTGPSTGTELASVLSLGGQLTRTE